MAKKIDLSMTVHDLVKKHPELKDVMKQIGFTDIAKPAALKTVGRVMTIPKGCAVKGFELADVVAQLEAAGFTCVEGTNEPAKGDKNDKKSKKDKKDKKDKGEKGKKKSNKDKKQKKAKKGKYAEKGEQVEQIEKIGGRGRQQARARIDCRARGRRGPAVPHRAAQGVCAPPHRG